MHVRASHATGQPPRRGAVVALVLVLLLAVVAVASSGHVPAGSNHTRPPSDQVLDTVVSLILLIVLAGAVGVFYVYYLQRTNARHAERRAHLGGSRRSPVIVVVFVLVALAIVVRTADSRRHHGELGGAGAPTRPENTGNDGYTPHFATVPVTVILGAAAIAVLALFLSRRSARRARPPEEASLALTLADVLGETLDDLRAEPDPRVAVIAAYARLERTLTAFGVPRHAADAPAEYLRRILIDLDVSALHASRLTQLFEHAKFSPHDVESARKDEAIELLQAVRTDLEAAEAARAAALSRAFPATQPA